MTRVRRNVRVGVVGAALAVVGLMGSAVAREPSAEAPPPPQQDGPERLDALRTPFDLKIQLGDSELVVLDARAAEDYRAGHVPGAVPVDLVAWTKKSLAAGGLEDAAFWAEALGRLGIAETKQVVVVGDQLPEAARAWWLLKYLGVRHAAVLDGGWAAWTKAKYPVEVTTPTVEPTTFAVALRPERLCTLTELDRELAAGSARVLDVRSDKEYAGEGRHIDGAVHLEWTRLVDAEGKLLPPDQIRATLAAAGITPEDAVVTHCMTGGRSSAVLLALEIAGFSKANNYYPGWSEYGRRGPAPPR